jgi:ubiquinone biosynthesis protein
MARNTLEKLNQPRPEAPAAQPQSNAWPLRLLGAALVAGAVSQGLALAPAAWAAWLSLGAGLTLILRR